VFEALMNESVLFSKCHRHRKRNVDAKIAVPSIFNGCGVRDRITT
jgi:hypothetical protein